MRSLADILSFAAGSPRRVLFSFVPTRPVSNPGLCSCSMRGSGVAPHLEHDGSGFGLSHLGEPDLPSSTGKNIPEPPRDQGRARQPEPVPRAAPDRARPSCAGARARRKSLIIEKDFLKQRIEEVAVEGPHLVRRGRTTSTKLLLCDARHEILTLIILYSDHRETCNRPRRHSRTA